MGRTNMPKSLQTRVFSQLKTNWRMSEGIERKNLYQDCPERLFNQLQIAINAKHLASVPLFQVTSCSFAGITFCAKFL